MSELEIGEILNQAHAAFELAKNGEDKPRSVTMRRLDLSYLNVHVQFSLGLTKAASSLGQSREHAIWTDEDKRNILLNKMEKVIKESNDPIINFDTSFREVEVLGKLIIEDPNPTAIVPVVKAWLALDNAFVEAGGKGNLEIHEKFGKISGGAVGQ